jgi:hypothetical protein
MKIIKYGEEDKYFLNNKQTPENQGSHVDFATSDSNKIEGDLEAVLNFLFNNAIFKNHYYPRK